MSLVMPPTCGIGFTAKESLNLMLCLVIMSNYSTNCNSHIVLTGWDAKSLNVERNNVERGNGPVFGFSF